MKPTTLLLLLLFAASNAFAQAPKKETLSFKIQRLKKLLNESDSISPEMTDSLDINNKIKTQLTEILSTPQIKNYDLEKTFTGSIEITHSKINNCGSLLGMKILEEALKATSPLFITKQRPTRPE